MAGTVEHQWNGSILTVISDSGASSADLKGPKGDTGPRGPQGPGGVIYNDEGELVIDLSPYATREELEYQIENNQPDLSIYATKPYVIEMVTNSQPDLTPYATQDYVAEKLQPYSTKAYVNNALIPYATTEYVDHEIENMDLSAYTTKDYVSLEIAKAQLEGAGVDTSGFATKEDIENIEINIDNKTIITNSDGTISTAIGGFVNNGGGVDYRLNNIEYTPSGPWNSYKTNSIGNIGKAWAPGCLYHITITFKDGGTIEFDTMYEEKYNSNGTFAALQMVSEYQTKLRAIQSRIGNFQPYTANDGDYSFSDGEFSYSLISIGDWIEGEACPNEFIATAVNVYADGYVPINANFVPIDGETIYINDDGKLASSGGATTDLSNYYTKSEVDAKITYGLVDITAGETSLTTGSLYVVYE